MMQRGNIYSTNQIRFSWIAGEELSFGSLPPVPSCSPTEEQVLKELEREHKTSLTRGITSFPRCWDSCVK